MSVVVTVLLVLAMMAVVCYRWAKVPEPTTAILVQGDASLDGAVIEVEPIDQIAVPERIIKVTLTAATRYQTPIFRYPGRYHVVATVPWQSRPIFDSMVSLDRLRGVKIELPTGLTIRGDGSMDGAKVVVTGQNGEASGVFDAANHYQLWVPTPPGDYDLLIVRDGKSLAQESFTIAAHTPKEVDLRKTPG